MHPGYYIAIISFVLVAGTFYVATWSETQRLEAIEKTHPPTVNITRDGDSVWIRWYGGWDSEFIDHVRVTCDQCWPVYQDYEKPRPGNYIHYAFVQPNVTLTVLGWDKAVQSYRQIASTTI